MALLTGVLLEVLTVLLEYLDFSSFQGIKDLLQKNTFIISNSWLFPLLF